MKTLQFSQNLKKYFSWKRLMFFWYRHYKVMFFFGFLVVLGFGGFIWYKNLYQYQWSEETKKTFLEQHFKETRFKERNFVGVVERLKERAIFHETTPVISRDIFSGKSLE
ncbi:MAG: hypothetical protein WA082_03330 [Candidatus Moraniibacteriota bacterium]